jgi:RHH-type proline utilization regulon transcriptional repressor/proline dehydrogenase/delta 1-pyrroline-5-carboxylate dehydrogenase
MGYKIAEIFLEAGLPPGVLNYLPGSGKEVGEYLVKHPDINFIVLTGSKEAGDRLDRLAAEHPHRHGIKKRILETGGKNGIIYDSDADMDDAIRGTIISWLGNQNQKCSAQSRAILLEDIYERFMERLIEATKSVKLGPPEDPANFMGPLISEEALRKVQRYVELGKQEGRLVYEGEVPAELREKGYYQAPVIFADVEPGARIAQEEIFGPVLAVIKAKTFDQALEIANSTGYALTGGVYSRNPAHIEKAKTEFEVGNLYINRAITGSIVGRQPFGGFKGSGTGPKAGGPDYLSAFMIEKTVTENIMRRGFAPLREDEPSE